MPNPFIKAGPANTSSGGDGGLPIGRQPVPEAYVGLNNPYRGVETHGVAPTESWVDTPENDMSIDVVVEEPEPEQEPVPVRIVTERSDAQKRFRVLRGITNPKVGNVFLPMIAIGSGPNMSKRKVFNLGTVALYIGPEQQQASAASGFPILANTSEDLGESTDSAIWIDSADGTAQPYAILVEYETET